MEQTTSESEQDAGVTSGEDNSFELPNACSSGRSETDSEFEQNSQVPYRTSASAANPDNYAGMMIASSYLPLMMQQSYQLAVPGTSTTSTMTVPYAANAANAFFFSQNSSKDAEGVAPTGSPLNLQMAVGQTDRQRIGSGHSDFSGAAVQQQHGIPTASPSPGVQRARASPHLIAGSSYASPAHQPTHSSYAGVTGNPLPDQGRFPGDVGYAKAQDGVAAKPTEYPPPPKKPLTPYMRFNKFVSLLTCI